MKLLLLITILTTQYLFATISIVPVEIGENPGTHGKVGASLETKRGNTHKDNYKAALRVGYDNNISFVTWAEISGEYGESHDVEDTNKAFLHFRYIHALTEETIRAELFAQTQEDKFKSIERRRIGGGGLRFRLFEIFENGKGYLGLGGYHENIKYTDENPTEHDVRLNSYFAYTINFSEDSSFSYTFYYQPIYNYLNDFVTAHKMELKLHIYQELFLQFKVSYDFDSRPPIGILEDDFTQTTEFVFNF
ncbi:MAG: DUF481 domain-containing protein [Campylobacterota bacterium]|nr:DUF481 domain-containing protein [Campylobacterota bacterium]